MIETDRAQTLATFLNCVLSKRYQSPTSDIIEVLAGLDNVDVVFHELVEALDKTIGHGQTSKYQQVWNRGIRLNAYS